MTDAAQTEPEDLAAPAPAGWGEPRSKLVTWYDPMITAAGMTGLSGLEFVQAIAEGRLAPAPIATLMNIRPVKVERGLVVAECGPDESVYNPIGMIHGGLLCTLADTVAGLAVHSTLEAGVAYTSIDIVVNFLRPVTLASGTLTATGRVVKPGRKVALATAEITDASGKAVGSATSNCLIMGVG